MAPNVRSGAQPPVLGSKPSSPIYWLVTLDKSLSFIEAQFTVMQNGDNNNASDELFLGVSLNYDLHGI